MKTVGSRELKNRLGRYLALVRKGETIVVTDRGVPFAHVTPLISDEGKPNGLDLLLKRLEAEGHLRLAKGPFKCRAFKPIDTKGKPASQIVIEDRE
jgi:prevent-host-death family protein